MMRRASAGSSGTSLRVKYARYGPVHIGSIRYTIVGSVGAAGSSAVAGALLPTLDVALGAQLPLGGERA